MKGVKNIELSTLSVTLLNGIMLKEGYKSIDEVALTLATEHIRQLEDDVFDDVLDCGIYDLMASEAYNDAETFSTSKTN